MRAMEFFFRRPNLPDRQSQEHMADFSRPKFVFGQVCIAHVAAKHPVNANSPTGFLQNLAVKGRKKRFAAVDSAARKLKFGQRFGLMSDQDKIVSWQYSVCAYSFFVIDSGYNRFTQPWNHS